MSPCIKWATLKEISSHREQMRPQRNLNISLMISQSLMSQFSLIQLLRSQTTTSTPSALRKWLISGDCVEVLLNFRHLGVMSPDSMRRVWAEETLSEQTENTRNRRWWNHPVEQRWWGHTDTQISQHAPACSCSGTRWPKKWEERPDESKRGEYRRWDETRWDSKRAKKKRGDEGN